MLKELEKQFPAKFGDKRNLVERVHSKTPEPGLASRLKKDNPAGYDYVKGLAIEANLIGGTPRQAPAPTTQTKPQPSATEVAEAVRKNSRERCIDLFLGTRAQSGETHHIEKLSSLSPEDRAQARLAATFWGLPLAGEHTSSVRFTYETSRDRRAKKEAKEAGEKAEQRRIADILPPGVHRDKDGNLSLADEVAFNAWKAERDANKEAIHFLEQQAA
jgi:hypothetical protein